MASAFCLAEQKEFGKGNQSMYTFYMPVHLVGGKNAVVQNAALFSRYGKRCLLVTGQHSAVSCGAQKDVAEALESQGILWSVYNKIEENPRMESCQEAAEAARSFRADFLVGIGGGSPMDAAKAVAVLAANPGITQEDLFGYHWQNSPLPILLVGTTSGTGSEVSPTAVLTCDDGRKRSITAPSLYAAASFGDSRYTYTMSRASTITTGLDALSHAVEGYVSPKCGSMISAFAEMAIPILWKHLYSMWEGENLTDSMHDALYEASLLAGFVLGAVGTSFPHPFGYVLTEEYGIPHGRACTTFLPALLEQVQKVVPEKVGRLLELCGCSRETFETVIVQLSDTGFLSMSGETIEKLRQRFTGLKHYKNVPGGYSADQALEVYRKLFQKTGFPAR